MNFPADFTRNILASFEDEGRKWLANLPALIEEASRRWGLNDIQPVPNLSYNFVAFATRPERSGTFSATKSKDKVVLKIGVPHRELVSEMTALKLFDGDGVCQLIDCDEEKGFLLIERLEPGAMLADLENDDERTQIAMDVMRKLWRSVPAAGDGGLSKRFIQLEDWFAELKNIRAEFDGGTGSFPKEILERVESLLPELFTDEYQLIHGDFHHFNVLSSERGWLAIDPKGVVGPVGYEIGPLMLNPWDNSMDRTPFKVRAKRRVDILSEGLGWAREEIIQWSTAHAVLSAWWDYPNGDWQYSLRCAEIFSELK
jgi:streptomycin 6-kinase